MKQQEVTSVGLLILRIGVGGMMLVGHGWGKLVRFPALLEGFPDPIGIGPAASAVLATAAEVVASLLVILGLGTRPAAVALAVTMLVAGLLHHAPDPWASKELALLYATAALCLVFTGGGGLALDRWMRVRRR